MQSIPLELRASSRWMAWCRIGSRKVPFNAKTGRGHTNYHDDPDAWSTFPQVARRVRTPSKERGWGLIVGAPFLVVDIDRCIEDGKLDRRATAILKELPATYNELSPSGTGIHLWYRCKDHDKLPQEAKLVFEVYSRRRFMTVTGAAVSPAPIRELSLAEAQSIFRLANPVYDSQDRQLSDEDGYWTPEALEALLKSWAADIRGFQYQNMAGKWAVPCPGYPEHTEKGPVLSRDAQVWVSDNGYAIFKCLHAHCAERKWRHFVDYYDPFGVFFSFDEWQEAELERLI